MLGILMSQIAIGLLINRGGWKLPRKKQPVTDDRWYTKPAPLLFLPEGHYWFGLLICIDIMEIVWVYQWSTDMPGRNI